MSIAKTTASQDQQLHAAWLNENLTVKNRQLIQEALNLIPEARYEVLLSTLTSVVEDRGRALNKAIDSGECPAYRRPELRTLKARRELAKCLLAYIDPLAAE